MIALFAVVALALGACGLGLVGLGVDLAVEGSIGAGLLSGACGALTLYGSYLFGRAAFRTRALRRAAPLAPDEVRAHRAIVRYYLGFAAATVIGNFLLPVPLGLRVVASIGAILVVPLLLVYEFEPRKRRTK